MIAGRVVLDSDFLSAFLKIDQLDLIRDFLKVEFVLVPPAVYREVSLTILISKLTAIQWIQIQSPDPARTQTLLRDSSFSRMGSGEQEAIALCTEQGGCILLMNDLQARQTAESLNVRVFTIPEFLLACKESGYLGRDRIAELVALLEERDHYGFRKDVRNELLS